MIAVIDTERNEPLTTGYELRLSGWTEERYWAEAPDDKVWEFVDGEVVVPSPVDIAHQWTTGFLTSLIREFCEVRRMGMVCNGPGAVSLRAGLVREPDIFVLSPADAARARGSKIEACPLLVIEVTDTDSERRDLVEKPAEYAARGIPDYWSVHLRKHHITVFRPGAPGRIHAVQSAGRLDSTGLPDFWIDVSWLWQDPLPGSLDCLKQILGVTSL